MKLYSTFIALVAGFFLLSFTSQAQQQWPKTATSSDGTVIKLYQLQPESYSNNTLKGRAAISIVNEDKADPVFGVVWFNAATEKNGEQVQVTSMEITSIKLPGDIKDDQLGNIQDALEKNSSEWSIAVASSELNSSLDLNNKEEQLSQQISNNPPKIIYNSKPSILVQIDGSPKIQRNNEWAMDAVVNTPFTIVKDNGAFFLYGGKHWYTAPAATGPYKLTTNINSKLEKVQQAVHDAGKNDDEGTEVDNNTIYNVLVSTEPAELIQSNGEANFAAVEGTDLLYVSNSQNDIFMDVNKQDYYVLLSGRWFKSKTLSGNWQYLSADKLPEDFAKIPAGSAKDNVLASVAGTEEAQDALEEAQVPQTAKVDRNTVRAEIAYDGDPEFDVIDGTEMAYAVNTSASVIRYRNRFYSVDNGVWFEARYATGPWVVATTRPSVVALIPPRYPVYHMKYVYIYDIAPDYVWMGYTPGYLNTFVYGPTIVYGTGFYYNSWYRNYYYPRPCTWGFSVRYNPWIGWGIGFNYSTAWLNGGFYGYRSHYYGGWWGPTYYRPNYCWSPNRFNGGYYGRNAIVYNNRYRNYNVVQRNYNTNVYRNRGGIVTRNYQRNYAPAGRGGRDNWSYNNRSNNNNRVRSNNFPGNRVDERGTRPSREYNPSNNRDRDNRNGNRYNNENGNRYGRQNNVQPNSNNPQRDGDINRNPSRRSDGWSGSRGGRTSNSRDNGQPGTNRPERTYTPETRRVETPANNNSEQPRSMPGRVQQPRRSEMISNDQGRSNNRTYQPQQRQAERRESYSPRAEQRSGGERMQQRSYGGGERVQRSGGGGGGERVQRGGGGGERPQRGGGGDRGGRRGN